MRQAFAPYREELVISTKAGYDMGPGPYGDWGSRKYLLASLDQSLARIGLDYVDIFYSHRADPDTPLEETVGALDAAVRQGKALYVGISSYGPERTREAATLLRELGTPLLIHQTMGALDTAVRSGKALYAGISSYSPDRTQEAYVILKSLGTPLLIHQPSYSMINRWIEGGLLDTLGELGARRC